jgi:hypothetical protein
MTKPELLALFRVAANDVTTPYLSSDTAVNGWITESEREGAERALYLRTGNAHNVAVAAGTADYTISSSIIFIDRAKLSGERLPLKQSTREELDYWRGDWELETGTPALFIIDGAVMTLYPKPNAAFTLQLGGSRRPEASMETPAHLHENLLYWVLYRHYSVPDTDSINAGSAAFNLKLFESVFGHKRNASFDNAWRNRSKNNHESSQF